MRHFDVTDLAERYVAIWNEPDPETRHQRVAELWSADAVMRLEPPQEVRAHAARLGVRPSMEARGHGELEKRVSRSYEEFVAPGGHAFTVRQGARRLGDVVAFEWSMVTTAQREPVGGGLEVVVVDRDGRITEDCQFIDR